MNSVFHEHATATTPAVPPALVSQIPPPTAAELYAEIPLAVHWSLYRILEAGVRHEQNLYGYFNSALNMVFSIHRRFQTNPQYPGRPSVMAGEPPHGHNVSIGSLGDIHGARGTAREEQIIYADFFITKTLPMDLDRPRINIPILALEIKSTTTATEDIIKQRMPIGQGIDQLARYCRTLSRGVYAQRDHTGFIPGYLVYGNCYAKLRPNGNVWEAEPWQYVFEDLALDEGRAPFLYRLCEIAVLNWNL